MHVDRAIVVAIELALNVDSNRIVPIQADFEACGELADEGRPQIRIKVVGPAGERLTVDDSRLAARSIQIDIVRGAHDAIWSEALGLGVPRNRSVPVIVGARSCGHW